MKFMHHAVLREFFLLSTVREAKRPFTTLKGSNILPDLEGKALFGSLTGLRGVETTPF
jgi:hypothetical protein